MAKRSTSMPPFPLLEWDDPFLTGEVVLPSWAGYQSRRGPYGSVSSPVASDGSASLLITPQDGTRQAPTTSGQAQAFRYLLDHEAAVGRSVLRAIFSEYVRVRDSYEHADEEVAELMPDIDSAEQLRSLIGLSNVHLLAVTKDGLAYVGFEFGCTWDDGHGLGVMTHRDRVVEVGGADTSFLAWIAERDAEAGNSSA